MYARQEDFICAAREQVELQRRLGILVARYLEEAVEFEMQRHGNVTEVLCEYYKFLMVIDCGMPDGVVQVVGREDSGEVVTQRLYDPGQMVEERLQKEIKTIVVKQEHPKKPLKLC